ncbi:TetR/AcrR family transcriptional regulator [Micromonospora sp. 4G55]|jgi:AcrR family transcriptional regulator|uniref:TetR/AcrR family transcriptional regulator n=1 Tax=Micromonospora sp. 4G55 TaxID=2806102 RepID=UPI001A3CEA48|nr:TetR/AcrR family transcriptional regulator [Micromonospora sp. 4G55]MBM0256651.1 TetR/AcrR family transcriptional regulator [Micromonospora sp. 4G55]
MADRSTEARPAGRKDARRNYERLLKAARAAFAEHGVGASLNDIARTAGVGNVTLYRHFPTRQALLEALLGESLRGLRTHSDELLASPMADEALTTWLAAAVEHAMAYRGLVDALVDSLADPESDLHATCQAIKAGGAQLLARAQRAGTVRPDLNASALFSLIASVAWASERAPEHYGQLLAVMLDGLRPRKGGQNT